MLLRNRVKQSCSVIDCFSEQKLSISWRTRLVCMLLALDVLILATERTCCLSDHSKYSDYGALLVFGTKPVLVFCLLPFP